MEASVASGSLTAAITDTEWSIVTDAEKIWDEAEVREGGDEIREWR